MNFGQK